MEASGRAASTDKVSPLHYTRRSNGDMVYVQVTTASDGNDGNRRKRKRYLSLYIV